MASSIRRCAAYAESECLLLTLDRVDLEGRVPAVVDALLEGRALFRPELVRAILKTGEHDRTAEMLEELAALLRHNDFIAENVQDETKLVRLCRRLKYRSLNAPEPFFLQGDIGREFFIVLSGHVGVYIKPVADAKPDKSDKPSDARLKARVKTTMAFQLKGSQLRKADIDRQVSEPPDGGGGPTESGGDAAGVAVTRRRRRAVSASGRHSAAVGAIVLRSVR